MQSSLNHRPPSSQTAMTRDIIRVKDLALTVDLTDGARWPTSRRQPVLASIDIYHDISGAAAADDLNQSINYSSVCKTIQNAVATTVHECLENLAVHLLHTVSTTHGLDNKLVIRLVKVKPPLHCRLAGLEAKWPGSTTDAPYTTMSYFIHGLACPTLVGINDCEREEKQDVLIDIAVRPTTSTIRFEFRAVSRAIYDKLGTATYLTLESLASFVARETLEFTVDPLAEVTICASKPDALVFAHSSAVEIIRTRADYPELFSPSPAGLVASTSVDNPTTTTTPLDDTSARTEPTNSSSNQNETKMVRAAIALGSNVGDSVSNIELALRLLERPAQFVGASQEDAEVAVVDTSFMYKTAPMYVTDQPDFFNCACVIETNVPPRLLLDLVKKIEQTVGRVPSIRNGPRAIDLDIVTYGSEVVDTRPEDQRARLDNLEGQLVVPHPRLAEREFVLRPLNDMIPDFVIPSLKCTVSSLLQSTVDRRPADEPIMEKVLPFPQYPLPQDFPTYAISPPLTSTIWTYPISPGPKNVPPKTRVMATLNATPDSFSDGALHNNTEGASAYIASSLAAGVDIIDIGGYSTRPGAAYVSPEEEIARVVPVIQLCRSTAPTLGHQQQQPAVSNTGDGSRNNSIPISIDTFRAEVAARAIEAGANCINDVYAFTGPTYPLDEAEAEERRREMCAVARRFVVPVILMHSRGDAGSNKDYSAYEHAGVQSAAVEGVRAELGAKVDAVVRGRGGVRRWLVVVDPGVGFSKTPKDNIDVIRYASSLTAESVDLGRYNPLAGFPQLIGTSRKSYLAAVLSDNGVAIQTIPAERDWATTPAVMAAVQQGALIIRVHNVEAMIQVMVVTRAFLK